MVENGSSWPADVVCGRFPELSGRRVLVTGGSSGIGKAVAQAFDANGAVVTVLARRKERLHAVVAQLKRGHAVVADLTVPGDLKRAVEEAKAAMGGLDILINNGGPATDAMIKQCDEAAGYEAGFQLHVSSAFALVKAAESELIANKGCVVNVSSIAGIQTKAEAWFGPYCVAKAAQEHLTRVLARLYAPHGVRVNSVMPAWVDTEAVDLSASIKQVSRDAFAKAAGAVHALNRISTAAEQAACIVFLCSTGAAFCTGCTLKVDGGNTLLDVPLPPFEPDAAEAPAA